MDEANKRRRFWPQFAIEVFAILNLGFLTFDIYLAHSVINFGIRRNIFP